MFLLNADIYLSMDYKNVTISHGANAMFLSRTLILAHGSSFGEYVYEMVAPKVLTECMVKSCVYIDLVTNIIFEINPVGNK